MVTNSPDERLAGKVAISIHGGPTIIIVAGEQLREVARIVFVVGILKNAGVAACFTNKRSDASALPTILYPPNHPKIWYGDFEVGENGGCGVG